MSTAAVLLAAGASSRFGSPKMLALVDGEPLVRRSVRAYLDAGVDDVVVVLGSTVAEVAAALGGLPARTVVNERWTDGMLSSVQTGLAALRVDAERIAVSPADLDLLESGDVSRTLRAAARASATTLVVGSHAGRRGHPLVFSRAVAARVLGWPASRRLSELLAEPDLAVLPVACGPGVLHDVDAPADLAPGTR